MRCRTASLVVSEETGSVSITRSGKIYRDVTRERLTNILKNFYKTKSENTNIFKELMKKQK